MLAGLGPPYRQERWAVINQRSDDDMDKGRIAGAAKETKGTITHQSVIKTTFLLYVTISGAIARE